MIFNQKDEVSQDDLSNVNQSPMIRFSNGTEIVGDYYKPRKVESYSHKILSAVNDQSLPGYPFGSVKAEDITTVSYLIKSMINPGDVAFLFGDSGTLKSFIATDIAVHLADGKDWHGLRVNQTGVLIVIGEGQTGFKKRLKAVIKAHGCDDLPIWVVPEPVALDRDSDLLRAWINQAEIELGFAIGLVVLDTFSLMLGSSDESSNSDVSHALNSLRKAVSGRSVLLIHHTGHGDKTRERGAYQIRGNADVRMLVERDEDGAGKVITVTCLKSKDDRPFDPINLGYQVVELGTDADGDPVTSLAIVGTDLTPVGKQHKKNKALDYVRQAITLCGSNQRDLVRDSFAGIYPDQNPETVRSAFRRGWKEYTEILTKDGRHDW